jgi:competence protein ComEC
MIEPRRHDPDEDALPRVHAAPLLCATAWGIAGATAGAWLPPLGAAIALLGLWSCRFRRLPARFAGLAALPALLAALPGLPAAPSPEPRPGPVRVQGTVHQISRWPIDGRTIVALSGDRTVPRLAFAGDVDVLPGDRIDVLAQAPRPSLPEATPLLRATPATLRVTPGPPSWWRAAAGLRRTLERALLDQMPPHEGALVATLVLGRDTRPDASAVRAHQATGLSHLLAVSGAHAAMLACLLGLSRRGTRLGASRWRTAGVLLLLATYGAISGAEPPVLRAVVAYSLGCLAARTGRSFGMVEGLAAPALLTALLDPRAIVEPSFTLSYAAVFGLALAGRPHGRPGPRRALAYALRCSFWASLTTAPLTLAWFGQLAPWTIALTPILSPLVGALLLLGLATAALGTLAPAIGALVALPTIWAAALYRTLVGTADLLPGTPILAPSTPPAHWIAVAVLLAAAVLAARPTRRGVAAALLPLVLVHFVPTPGPREDTFTLCAVGHGQAAAITRKDGHLAAIDCGSQTSALRAAERLARALPARRLDLLVITHADHDHHNGVPALLQSVWIAAAVLPGDLRGSVVADALEASGTAVRWLAPGDVFEAAPHLEVLAPPLPLAASTNDRSLWVRATIGGLRVLTTGDAQEAGIAAALAGGFVQPCDVLVLPHHGRPNHNTPHLLQRAAPRIALASAATGDGETSLGAVARRFGCEVWTTGLDGTITIGADPPRIAGSAGPRRLVPRPP